MGRTPDRLPGVGKEDGSVYDDEGVDATQEGEIRYNTDRFSMFDGAGEFNPRESTGPIDKLSDVDTTTTPPVAGNSLQWDGTNWVPVDLDNSFTVFAIWAEENGGLANNQTEWSFGNGSTGSIGIPLPIACDLFAITVNSANSASGTVINVRRNNNDVADSNALTGNNNVTVLGSPVAFSAGDLLGFETEIAGGANNVRVAAWFRIPSTPVSTLLIGDLLDVDTTTAPTTGQVLEWNGSNFVPATLSYAIDDLTDVDTTTTPPNADDVLVWDGTNWVPQAPIDSLPAPDTGSILYSADGVTWEVVVPLDFLTNNDGILIVKG